ncbi:hypothetical protein [Ferruginibacter sp.]|nr:hypothetical protein [Ferruginibacter sp.]
MTEEKKDKIRKQLKSGFPEGEIKNELSKQGLTEEEIKEIFTVQKGDMRSWYLISAILVLILALYIVSKTGMISLLFFGLSGLLFYEYYKAQRKAE